MEGFRRAQRAVSLLRVGNPKKRTGIMGYGLEIVENIPIEIKSNEHNELYLKTKRAKLGHTLKLG